MVARVLKIIFIESLIYKVMASYVQHTQQYYQTPGQQYYQVPNAPITSIGNSYTSYMPSSHQPAVTPYIDYSSYSIAPLKSYKPPDIPVKPIKLPNSDSLPVKSNIPTPATPTIDTNVLNNLAIALQLLIVSNLLNSPLPEKTSNIHTSCQPNLHYESSKAVSPGSTFYSSNTNLNNIPGLSDPVSQTHSHLQPNEYQVYFDPNPYDQTYTQPIPNANYMGSSQNFGDLLSSFGVPPATARPGLNLKSPYEALSSPFNSHTPSNTFEYTKRDLQSPYAAIMAADSYKDLFSIDF